MVSDGVWRKADFWTADGSLPGSNHLNQYTVDIGTRAIASGNQVPGVGIWCNRNTAAGLAIAPEISRGSAGFEIGGFALCNKKVAADAYCWLRGHRNGNGVAAGLASVTNGAAVAGGLVWT